MQITILTENTVYQQGILAEHGLSLLIEEKDKRYLFDTGQTDVFLKNADKLGVDLNHLDGIILSHGHYDHCGGLKNYAKKYSLPNVYVRENAFETKVHKDINNGTVRAIGIPWEANSVKEHLIFTDQFTQLSDQIYLLGGIPFQNDFESVARGLLVKKGDEFVTDPMNDEQMLIIRNEKGLNVFLGCSHAGVINAITYIEQYFPGEHIHMLFAGMHLSMANREQKDKTMEEIEKRKIDIIIPVHCTGIIAITELKKRFGKSCRIVQSGKVLTI